MSVGIREIGSASLPVLLLLLSLSCTGPRLVDLNANGSRPYADNRLSLRELQFPLALGNRWIYVDSIPQSAGTIVRFDTITISGSYSDSLGTWWQLTVGWPYVAAGLLMSRNDSIFTKNECDSVTLAYIPFPLRGKIYFFSEPFTGPVRTCAETMTQPYSTPMGEFKDCAKFTMLVDNDFPYLTNIVKPGVGIVGYIWYVGYWFPNGTPAFAHARLISYSINQ